MFSKNCSIKPTFLFSFSFFSWITVKPIQVIIISSEIYSSIIVLWSFIFLDIKYPLSYLIKPSFLFFDLCVSYLLDQHSFILELVLGCDWKVARTQTINTDFLPPRACGRSWQGCWFLWLHLSPSIHKLALS